MKILLTGSSGQLGAEIARQLFEQRGRELPESIDLVYVISKAREILAIKILRKFF